LLIRGTNVEIGSMVPALVVPLYTKCGYLDINVALVEHDSK